MPDDRSKSTRSQLARRLRDLADNLSRRGDIDPGTLRDLHAAANGMDKGFDGERAKYDRT